MLKAITADTLFNGTHYLECHAILYDCSKIHSVIPVTKVDSSVDLIDCGDAVITPGFIDIQVNGGGGVMFNDAQSIAGIKTIIEAHRKGGITHLLPTLISETPSTMSAALRAVEQGIKQKTSGLLGIHLEGPWLNSVKKGLMTKVSFIVRPLNN